MKPHKFILVLFIIMIAFSACQKDIIVKDIENETVTALSPPDGYNTPNNSITFWWEKVDGAEKYNIQIVSPSFSNIQQLITDSSVTTDKFTKVLTPGTYQWRVRATNNGGNTAWTTRTLTIDTSSNLTYSAVILLSPADSFYTSATSAYLSWSPVSNATVYSLSIPGVINSTSYSTTAATISFPTEGTYTWSVRAENSFSFSPYSSRKIFIDRTAPTSSPTLNYPISTTPTVPADTLMSWTTISESYKDVVLISDVSDFSNTIKMDTVSSGSGSVRTYSISNISNPSGNTYHWKVKSIDRAGNVGNYGTSKSFSVQ
ncbi:MAG: hypothetical protein Q8M29_01295 [Bacteroidota bacterium]|nr:hypothetical protein [Bacteroidota bacterium]